MYATKNKVVKSIAADGCNNATKRYYWPYPGHGVGIINQGKYGEYQQAKDQYAEPWENVCSVYKLFHILSVLTLILVLTL